jgi:nucleoside 2-deoxyribosyltransferase
MTYLCGSINGCNDSEAKDWRVSAASLLGDVIDPMRNDYRGKEKGNESLIIAQDIKDIVSCQQVLANVSRPSWGTAMEIFFAHSIGIPVFAFGQSSSPWVVHHVSHLDRCLEVSIERILCKQ